MKKNKLQNIENWLDERFDLTPIKKLITHKKVPIHNHSVWYYMGGISLFLFIVQVLSGLLLLMPTLPSLVMVKIFLSPIGSLFQNLKSSEVRS